MVVAVALTTAQDALPSQDEFTPDFHFIWDTIVPPWVTESPIYDEEPVFAK